MMFYIFYGKNFHDMYSPSYPWSDLFVQKQFRLTIMSQKIRIIIFIILQYFVIEKELHTYIGSQISEKLKQIK